jgi:hypothetical protein
MAPAEPAAKRAASGDLDAAANGDGMPPVMADGRCNSRALSFSELQRSGSKHMPMGQQSHGRLVQQTTRHTPGKAMLADPL